MNLYDELLKLIDLLNEAEIDFAICGGIAVAFHGYPRFTKDIDILIQSVDLDRIRSLAHTAGYTIWAGPIPFGKGTHNERIMYRISKIVSPDVLSLDMIVVSPAIETAWFERELFEWQGRHVPVVSVEGLYTLKRLSGRDQDLLDLKMLGYEFERTKDGTQDQNG